MRKYLLCLLVFSSLFAYEPRELLFVGSGVFNIVRNKPSVIAQLEYRSDFVIYHGGPLWIYPLVGVMATSSGSGFFFGGMAFEFPIGDHLVFTPSFATGIYVKGGGMELGFPQENRSSAELAYVFNNGGRLGAQFYHISNASLGFRNPGTECLVFFYGIPLN